MIVVGSGCESKPTEPRRAVHPVSGKVFVQKKPAVGAFVVFVPVNESPNPTDPRPHAEVQEDGSFALGTYADADGAPAGDYIVIITWPGRTDAAGRDEPEDKLFGRFADPQKSRLRATVKEGKNELEPWQL